MYYVSPFTYLLHILAVARLVGVDIKCFPIELLELQIPHDWGLELVVITEYLEQTSVVMSLIRLL